jgi:hypothetical protein
VEGVEGVLLLDAFRVIAVRTRGVNQREEVVTTFERAIMLPLQG